MLNPNYSHVITLYNRLKACDAGGQKDQWKRTVLKNCFYKSETVQLQDGTEVTKNNSYTVRIPASDEYHPYAVWKTDRKGFTVSEDDIVIHGECHEEITGEANSTATKILQAHKPDAFRVTSFSDNTAFPADKHYRLGG